MLEIKEHVARANHILITSHVSLDGDAVGASLALGHALRKLGKRTTVAFSDAIPPMFRFLPGWEEAKGPKADLGGLDLIFVLDLSDIERVGQLYDKHLFGGVPIINVDHHPTNTNFGTVNVVVPEAAAACEIVASIIASLDVVLDKEMAVCLLTGLVTDTLGFRVPTASAKTLRLAADLVDYGINLAAISDAVFNSKAYPVVKLMGLALAQVQRRGRIVWTIVTREMLAASDAGLEESESIVNLLNSVRDADAAIVFKEMEDGTTRVSIRTSDVLNAGQLCQRFGGGGHFRAAGCGLQAGLQAAQQSFIAYVEDALSSTQQT